MSIPTKVRFRGATYVIAKKHPRQEYEELSRMGKNIFWSSLLFKEGGEELVRYSLNMGKTYDDKPRERESSSIDNDQPSTGESPNAPLYPTEIPTQHRASSPEHVYGARCVKAGLEPKEIVQHIGPYLKPLGFDKLDEATQTLIAYRLSMKKDVKDILEKILEMAKYAKWVKQVQQYLPQLQQTIQSGLPTLYQEARKTMQESQQWLKQHGDKPVDKTMFASLSSSIGLPAQHRASSPEFLRFNGYLYRAVGAAHPTMDTDGSPLSDLKSKDKGEQSIVQEALDESRDMYFEYKGDPKKKEKGINPDYGDSHPGFGAGGPGDGGGDGGGGNGGGNGGGGE